MLTTTTKVKDPDEIEEQIINEEYNDSRLLFEEGWLSDQMPSQMAARNDKNRLEEN